MATATLSKFDSFVEALAEKKHDFSADTVKLLLTNTLPLASYSTKADIIGELSTGGGYTSGGAQSVVASSSQTSGTYKLVLSDVTFTATAGGFGPFRYVVVYNDTAANDELIGWYDYGSSITPSEGETFLADFDADAGALTIS